MSRGRIIAGVIVLAVVAAIVGGVLYSSASSATTVTTAKATKRDLGVTVTASGKVEGNRRADVYPPTAGLLTDVYVSDGETVTAGDKLAKMDTRPLTSQVRQAASALEAAEAQLEAVNNGVPSAVDKAAASAAVDAAEEGYKVAKAGYDAYKSAFDAAPPATQASMEATLTQLLLSKKSAYASLQSAKSGKSKLSRAAKVTEAKDAAQAAVDAASYALALAKSTRDDGTLVAPIDGVVVFNPTGTPGTDSALPKAQAGTAVSPGSAPFTIVDLGSLSFDAQVDEADVSKVSSGMKASVSLDAFSGMTFTGKVASVRATAIQTTTGGIAFPVLISLDEAGSRLLLGMSGSADIQVDAVTGALVVPIESVLDDSGKKYVFVVTSGNTVKKTEVTTGALTDTDAQILSGISDGDTVVTSQLTTLKDGQAVRPQ